MFKYLAIIFLSFLLFSCSDNQNDNKTEDLCKDIACGAGYECNQDNGICEKLDNYCINDTQCGDAEYCDKIHSVCKLIDINNGCEKHEDCETWEVCDFLRRECTTRVGMCNEDKDCTVYPFFECNIRLHKCRDPENCFYTGCDFWEKCDTSDGVCDLIDGYCNDNADCDNKFPYTECNMDAHTCEVPIIECTSYTQCNTWEICNLDKGICESEAGNCTSFLDCVNNTDSKIECDTVNHLCKTPEELSCVTNGCSFFWRTCNEITGVCDLPDGSCDTIDDCNGDGIEICSNEHKCVRDDCTVFGCSWWKTCDEDTGICNPRVSMCDTDSDCIDDAPFTACNTLIHFCQKPESMECTEDGHCDDWEQCNLNTDRCELKEGHCLNNEQCSSEQYCNVDDHKCYDED